MRRSNYSDSADVPVRPRGQIPLLVRICCLGLAIPFLGMGGMWIMHVFAHRRITFEPSTGFGVSALAWGLILTITGIRGKFPLRW